MQLNNDDDQSLSVQKIQVERFNPLDVELFFCQTPVGARLIFSMLLLGAELIFINLPPGAGLFFEPGKRRDPSQALMPVTK